MCSHQCEQPARNCRDVTISRPSTTLHRAQTQLQLLQQQQQQQQQQYKPHDDPHVNVGQMRKQDQERQKQGQSIIHGPHQVHDSGSSALPAMPQPQQALKTAMATKGMESLQIAAAAQRPAKGQQPVAAPRPTTSEVDASSQADGQQLTIMHHMLVQHGKLLDLVCMLTNNSTAAAAIRRSSDLLQVGIGHQSPAASVQVQVWQAGLGWHWVQHLWRELNEFSAGDAVAVAVCFLRYPISAHMALGCVQIFLSSASIAQGPTPCCMAVIRLCNRSCMQQQPLCLAAAYTSMCTHCLSLVGALLMTGACWWRWSRHMCTWWAGQRHHQSAAAMPAAAAGRPGIEAAAARLPVTEAAIRPCAQAHDAAAGGCSAAVGRYGEAEGGSQQVWSSLHWCRMSIIMP